MSPQEKSILKALVIVNVLIMCCGMPALLVYLDVGGIQAQALALVPEMPPTSTPRATLTPTRVIPTATLEAGWKLYPVPSQGFSMALPSSWAYQELDPATMQQAIQTLKQKNQQMAQTLEKQGQELTKAGVKFFAVDGASGSVADGVSTNVNVIRLAQPQSITLDFFVARNIPELEAQPNVSKPVKHWRVQLYGIEAEELRYTTSFIFSGTQPTQLGTTQHLIVRGKDCYILTFVTSTKLESKYVPIFEKIAKTFR
jgi:hypothetical protein